MYHCACEWLLPNSTGYEPRLIAWVLRLSSCVPVYTSYLRVAHSGLMLHRL